MQILIKIDPPKRMYRWYAVGIQETLIYGIAVIYGWGSIKSSFQQWRTVEVQSLDVAEQIVAGILQARIRKGYILAKKDTLSKTLRKIL